MDYSSWLIEDLEDYINELLIVRTRAELYSERAECNAQIQEIKTEDNKKSEEKPITLDSVNGIASNSHDPR